MILKRVVRYEQRSGRSDAEVRNGTRMEFDSFNGDLLVFGFGHKSQVLPGVSPLDSTDVVRGPGAAGKERSIIDLRLCLRRMDSRDCL